MGSRAALSSEKLLVGSIKTVIGHTEGTAGLASVISTSLALKHGIVPPNLHFDKLSPKVAPFFKHLEIPTAPTAWPNGGSEIRRASVNRYVKNVFDCLIACLASDQFWIWRNQRPLHSGDIRTQVHDEDILKPTFHTTHTLGRFRHSASDDAVMAPGLPQGKS